MVHRGSFLHTWIFLALVFALTSGFAPEVRAQSPKILIDTNQMNSYEAHHANLLHGADGCWMVSFNSSGFDLNLWKYVASQIGTGTFVSEDGVIGTSWVLNYKFSPHVVLQSSTGNYVAADGVEGANVAANVSDINQADVALRYYGFAATGPPNPMDLPVTFLLFDHADIFLQSLGGLWVKAPNGGGKPLITTAASAEYWDVFRLYKQGGGDNVLRSYDKVAIQSCNGIAVGTIKAGSILSVNGNNGGLITPSKASVGNAETFVVRYPCEYVASSQIAHVTHAFAYTEFNDEIPKQSDGSWTRDWTLSNDLIDSVANRTGCHSILVLTRTFQDVSQYPGILPTHKQQVLNAISDANCKGVVFEMFAGQDMGPGNILAGIDAVASRGKSCFFVLPPQSGSTNYSSDIKKSLLQLKQSKWYRKLNIVLACYSRNDTGVGFLGGSNSVQGALQWLLKNR